MSATRTAPAEPAPLHLSEEQIALLRRTTAGGRLSDDQFRLYLERIRRTRLDPFSDQISAELRENRRENRWDLVIITGIAGFRLIAERTGLRDGEDPPQWCGPDGEWTELWTSDRPPFAARCTLYRKDSSRPYYGIAHHRAYCPQRKLGSTEWWHKAPDHMLLTRAEILALRKAFPNETAGLSTREELSAGRADDAAEPAAQSPAPSRPPAMTKAERGRVGTLLGALKRSGSCEDWWNRYEKEVLAMSPGAQAELREAYKARWRADAAEAAAARLREAADAGEGDAPPPGGEVAPGETPDPPPGAGDAWEPGAGDYDETTGEVYDPPDAAGELADEPSAPDAGEVA